MRGGDGHLLLFGVDATAGAVAFFRLLALAASQPECPAFGCVVPPVFSAHAVGVDALGLQLSAMCLDAVHLCLYSEVVEVPNRRCRWIGNRVAVKAGFGNVAAVGCGSRINPASANVIVQINRPAYPPDSQ